MYYIVGRISNTVKASKVKKLPECATCAGKKIRWKLSAICGVIKNAQQLKKWSIQSFTIKNTVIVFAAFIVEVDYFNGKPTTTLGTSMQNGFLCVNVLKKQGVEYVKMYVANTWI